MKGTVGWFRATANQLESNTLVISELIKNCYDADATVVQLNLKDAFKPLGQNPEFYIRDNGHGMSMDDILRKWLRVGDSVNNTEKYSPGGRIRQGGKGTGRLGAWSIGEKVTVYTSKKGHSPIGLEIDISELPNSALLKEIKHEPVEGASDFFPRGEYGTVIMVQSFVDKLSNSIQFCANMNRNILLLQNPFEGLDDFQILPLYPEEAKISLKDFNLKALAENGLYHADLVIRDNIIEGKLTNNNKLCENYESVLDIAETIDAPVGVKLKNIEIKIRAFMQDSVYQYTKVLPGSNQALGKERFDECTGFRLYKNGIRVQPGGKDWLNLDRDKAKRFDSIFRSSQVIAMANYNSEINPGLKEVAARNKLVENQTKKYLVKCLNQAVRELRKFAGKIPTKMPRHLSPPSLAYSLVEESVNSKFNSGEPSNMGGKFETVSVHSMDISDVKIDSKTAVISGTIPSEPGDYVVSIISENEHGRSEDVLQIKAEPIIPDEDNDIDDDEQENNGDDEVIVVPPVKPHSPNVPVKNKISTSLSTLRGTLSIIDDVNTIDKINHIISQLEELIQSL